MEGTGLIIGIEYNKTVKQACVYDMKSHAPVAYDEVKGLDIDTALMRICEKYNTKDIDSLCITGTDMYTPELEEIGHNICGPSMNIGNCMLIGHVQAFAYYAYSQRKELYQSGVVLMDYDGGIVNVSRLSYNTENGIQYISDQCERYETFNDIKGNKTGDVINGNHDNAAVIKTDKDNYSNHGNDSDSNVNGNVDGNIDGNVGTAQNYLMDKESRNNNIIRNSHILSEYIAGYFNEHTASSVYLTGDGFDVDRLPDELSRTLIRGRKAYIGQNLYVRGACYAAYEAVYKDVFDNVVLLVDGCIGANIEVDISEHEHPMRFRMIKQGTDWHMAARSADFIIEDMTALPLKLVYPDGSCAERIIDISSIPYREGKTTRIRLDIKALSKDRCQVTVKDLGFGEIFPSSGKIITEEIDISEGCV